MSEECTSLPMSRPVNNQATTSNVALPHVVIIDIGPGHATLKDYFGIECPWPVNAVACNPFTAPPQAV